MVNAGEEVVVTRRGKQVAKITAIVEDDPRERDVDWASWVEAHRERLAAMPHVGESPVLAERESYRW